MWCDEVEGEKMTDEVLLDKLKSPFSPFLWGIIDVRKNWCKVNFVEQIEEKQRDQKNDRFKSFCLALVICMEHFAEDELEAAGKWLVACERLLSEGADDSHIGPYRTALIFVLYACQAHFAFFSGDRTAARNFQEEIVNFEDLKADQQSAVMATKANVLQEYGPEGCRMGLEAAREAVRMWGKEWAWELLVGQIWRRLRYFDRSSGEPEREELSALRKAYSLGKNPETAIALADCYSDIAYAAHRDSHSHDREAIDFNNRRAFEFYCIGNELNEEERVDLMLRCAKGLSQIPRNIASADVAFKLITKVLGKEPNHPEAKEIAAILEEKPQKTGKKMTEKTYDRVALGTKLTQIGKMAEVEGGDPMPSYEVLLEELPPQGRLIVCLEVAAYQLAVNKSILSAQEYLVLALRINPKFPAIRKYRLRWTKPTSTVNLVRAIEEAAEKALLERKYEGIEEAGRIVEKLVDIRKLAGNRGAPEKKKLISKKPSQKPILKANEAAEKPTQVKEDDAQLSIFHLLQKCKQYNSARLGPEELDTDNMCQRVPQIGKVLSLNEVIKKSE